MTSDREPEPTADQHADAIRDWIASGDAGLWSSSATPLPEESSFWDELRRNVADPEFAVAYTEVVGEIQMTDTIFNALIEAGFAEDDVRGLFTDGGREVTIADLAKLPNRTEFPGVE